MPDGDFFGVPLAPFGKDELPIDTGLYVYLIKTSTNKVIDAIILDETGEYSFNNVTGNTAYKLLVTSQYVGLNQNAPNGSTMPTFWEITGENIGSGAGNDGTVDGFLNVNALAANISNLNFGIRLTDTGIAKGVYSLDNNYFLENGEDVESYYNTFIPTTVTTIQTLFGVGTSGIVQVKISYARLGVFLQEVINVDTTSPTTFWNDIKNWMYANDYTDIVYDGESFYVIVDYVNRTYLALQTT